MLRRGIRFAPAANGSTFPPWLLLDPAAFLPEWASTFGLTITPDFVSAEAEAQLLAAVEPALSSRRWESGHWDGAAAGKYREASLPLAGLRAGPAAAAALQNALARFPIGAQPQSALHALEMAPGASIGAHVDSVKFLGGCVQGLCLLGDAVLTLVEDPPPATPTPPRRLVLRLPRRAGYLLQGDARYNFSHAITLCGSRRVSVILRDEPTPLPPPAPAAFVSVSAVGRIE